MKSLSEKQLAANRANAAKSTGPRTPEGKARAALNSRKHGLAAAAFTVTALEDRDALDNLIHDAVAHYCPANSQEQFAVERIALAQLGDPPRLSPRSRRPRLRLRCRPKTRHRNRPRPPVSGRRWRACALATVRRSNCTCSFPAYSFHEDSRFRDAIEGIN